MRLLPRLESHESRATLTISGGDSGSLPGVAIGSSDSASSKVKGQRGNRGSVAVEVTLIVPLVVMLMLGLAGGWRIGWARAQLAEAAAAGARAATLAGSAPQAVQQATAAIEFDLATVDVHCSSLSVQIDASAFNSAPGHHAEVSAELGCRLDLADVLVPGLPGAVQLEARATEALDVFKERTP